MFSPGFSQEGQRNAHFVFFSLIKRCPVNMISYCELFFNMDNFYLQKKSTKSLAYKCPPFTETEVCCSP